MCAAMGTYALQSESRQVEPSLQLGPLPPCTLLQATCRCWLTPPSAPWPTPLAWPRWVPMRSKSGTSPSATGQQATRAPAAVVAVSARARYGPSSCCCCCCCAKHAVLICCHLDPLSY